MEPDSSVELGAGVEEFVVGAELVASAEPVSVEKGVEELITGVELLTGL